MELYDRVFQAFGVPRSQFSALMSQGQRCRADMGGFIVKGSTAFPRVALLVSGEAVAHEHTAGEPEGEPGKPIWKFVGKLPGGQAAADGQPPGLPTRGSLVSGSALVGAPGVGSAHDVDVIASTHVEWVEWDAEALQRSIEEQQWRSVQAAFLHMLCVDLLGQRASSPQASVEAPEALSEDSDPKEDTPMPRPRQLLMLSAAVAIPFFGFGLADNGIMILAGDAIDAHFGAALGLTTLAAAGLGNWLSDIVGLGLGDAIEQAAARLGLGDGGLTPAQAKLRVARFTSLMAKMVGITLGCFAGMLPLLIITPRRKEFANEDLKIYDQAFRPNGVSTSQFEELLDRGTKHWASAGAMVIQGGTPFNKVALLLQGEATAYECASGKRKERPRCTYIGRLEKDGTPADRSVPSRGSIIGGTALADHSVRMANYPNDVIASKNVQWIEWNVEDLVDFLHGEKAVEASFYAMLYIQTFSKDTHSQTLEKYHLLMAAVVSDGVVDPRERQFIDNERKKLEISSQEHYQALRDLGWTIEGWERGCMSSWTKIRPKVFRMPTPPLHGAADQE